MVVGGASIVLCLLAASLEPVTLEWLTFFFFGVCMGDVPGFELQALDFHSRCSTT
jgi:hypothetical protein